MKANHIGKNAYLVLNTATEHDDVWLIPATATHIWIMPSRHNSFICFDIFADVRYNTTTPLHCGSFDLELDDIFGDDCYYGKLDGIDALDLVDYDDCHELAVLLARQIAEFGEVDCIRLVEYAKNGIVKKMIKRYQDIKKGKEQ